MSILVIVVALITVLENCATSKHYLLLVLTTNCLQHWSTSTGASSRLPSAPMLLAMCYQHQWVNHLTRPPEGPELDHQEDVFKPILPIVPQPHIPGKKLPPLGNHNWAKISLVMDTFENVLLFSDLIKKGTSTKCLCQVGSILRLHKNPKTLLHCIFSS